MCLCSILCLQLISTDTTQRCTKSEGTRSKTNLKGADDSAIKPLTILIKTLPGKVNLSPLFSTLFFLGNTDMISMRMTITIIDVDGKSIHVFRKVWWFIKWNPVQWLHSCDKLTCKTHQGLLPTMGRSSYLLYSTAKTPEGLLKTHLECPFPGLPEGAQVREAILVLFPPLRDPGKVIFLSKIIFFSCKNGNNSTMGFRTLLWE